VTLAKITFSNAQKWALAHNRPSDPDSVVMDLADYYDHDERELNRMIHSSGPERMYMADPQDGGDNIDKRGDGEDGDVGVRRNSNGEHGDRGNWREDDERGHDGNWQQDGDDGDWYQDRDSGGYQGGYEDGDNYNTGTEE